MRRAARKQRQGSGTHTGQAGWRCPHTAGASPRLPCNGAGVRRFVPLAAGCAGRVGTKRRGRCVDNSRDGQATCPAVGSNAAKPLHHSCLPPSRCAATRPTQTQASRVLCCVEGTHTHPFKWLRCVRCDGDHTPSTPCNRAPAHREGRAASPAVGGRAPSRPAGRQRPRARTPALRQGAHGLRTTAQDSDRCRRRCRRCVATPSSATHARCGRTSARETHRAARVHAGCGCCTDAAGGCSAQCCRAQQVSPGLGSRLRDSV